jgi:hypothetical protein
LKSEDIQWRHAAVEEVQHALSEDPNLAYAHYLKSELRDSQTPDLPSASGIFAIAFVDAMRRKDSGRLSALESAHPGLSQLFDVARAFLFEDKAAAERTISWMNNRAEVEPRPVAALRGFIAHRFADIADGERFIQLIVANDNVRLDLIESALVPADLALAA